MTIDKRDTVTIPVWLLSSGISIICAGLITWGGISATKAVLETRALRNEKEIEILRAEKVSKNEFDLVLDKLNSIEKKLDSHIQK